MIDTFAYYSFLTAGRDLPDPYATPAGVPAQPPPEAPAATQASAGITHVK